MRICSARALTVRTRAPWRSLARGEGWSTLDWLGRKTKTNFSHISHTINISFVFAGLRVVYGSADATCTRM